MPTPQQLASSFIQYLKEQDLYAQLEGVVEELEAEVKRNQDITVVSALGLEKPEQASLEKLLTEKWGEHRIVYTVDPILISGMIVRYQDQVLDLSGKGALTDLAHQLNQ